MVQVVSIGPTQLISQGGQRLERTLSEQIQITYRIHTSDLTCTDVSDTQPIVEILLSQSTRNLIVLVAREWVTQVGSDRVQAIPRYTIQRTFEEPGRRTGVAGVVERSNAVRIHFTQLWQLSSD
ncbi:hypothetical protein D3C85_1157800 [compost metagenome]